MLGKAGEVREGQFVEGLGLYSKQGSWNLTWDCCDLCVSMTCCSFIVAAFFDASAVNS